MSVVDALQLLRTQLEDPSTGVNAVLGSVPRDASDPAPAPIAAIYDELTTPWLARFQLDGEALAANSPALLLTHHPLVELPPTAQAAAQGAQLPCAITYIDARGYDAQGGSSIAARDAAQTLRALFRSTAGVWLNMPSAGSPRITRNGVAFELVAAEFLTHGPITADGALIRTLLVGLNAHDPWMNGYV